MLFIAPLITGMIDSTSNRLVSLDQRKDVEESSSIENDELLKEKMVSTISGSYYGLMNFVFSIGGGIVSLILGFIFSGSNATNSLLIGLVFASMSIFFLFELIMLYRIKIEIELE